jgi:hypothetical protein
MMIERIIPAARSFKLSELLSVQEERIRSKASYDSYVVKLEKIRALLSTFTITRALVALTSLERIIPAAFTSHLRLH